MRALTAAACLAADRLAKVPGVTVLNDTFFNEFTVLLGTDARTVVRQLADDGVLAGVSLGRLFREARIWQTDCWLPSLKPPSRRTSKRLPPHSRRCWHEHAQCIGLEARHTRRRP